MSTFVSRRGQYLATLLVVLAILAAALVASQGEARAFVAARNVVGAEVETEMNAGNATSGGTGWALVSVLVTNSRNQRPLKNVAASISTDAGGITLPSRIAIDHVTVAAGGCTITPTQLINGGNGVYTIRFVPYVDNAACKWKSGDYIYNVTIKDAGGRVLGQGLAKLSV